MVCVDYEGAWGMPFAAHYDLTASTHQILESLERHSVRATFFIVGALALEHPNLVDAISTRGHEVAVHGWKHEHLGRLTAAELDRFAEGLDESVAAMHAITGRRPTGFRAPYLMGPTFYDPAVYELLADRYYLWTSNRELRHVVELLRPDRLRSDGPWRFAESHANALTGVTANLLSVGLNTSVWMKDRVGGSRRSAIQWLTSGSPPFFRGSLLEIPMYSPMDCDLLGMPEPSASTTDSLLEFSRFALISILSQPGPFKMLTFHDWIISGGNRLLLLDDVLSSLHEVGAEAVTIGETWAELAACATNSA